MHAHRVESRCNIDQLCYTHIVEQRAIAEVIFRSVDLHIIELCKRAHYRDDSMREKKKKSLDAFYSREKENYNVIFLCIHVRKMSTGGKNIYIFCPRYIRIIYLRTHREEKKKK